MAITTKEMKADTLTTTKHCEKIQRGQKGEVSQKEKRECHIRVHICGPRKMVLMNLFAGQK